MANEIANIIKSTELGFLRKCLRTDCTDLMMVKFNLLMRFATRFKNIIGVVPAVDIDEVIVTIMLFSYTTLVATTLVKDRFEDVGEVEDRLPKTVGLRLQPKNKRA